jgi:beta-glucosidase
MKSLLQTLTLKEKIGQLTQLAPFFLMHDIQVEIAGHVRHLNLDEDKIYSIGSILGIGSAKDMRLVQEKYLEKSRHKIPLLFMSDIIHGYKTIFPVPLAISSSWNPDLAFLCARISAKEATTAGIHVTFSPMADVSRDPRWGRVVEGFGEDPYLVGEFAAAMVQGYQGNDLKQEDSMISCVKHFAGYGASEAGRDYNTVDVSRLSLFQTYLPAYKKALDAGAKMIMSSFNTLDGIPCTTNTFLLRDVLRTLWKFEGITISDYDSLQQTIAHGHSENQKVAAKHGIFAGLDIEMASTTYLSYLEELIAQDVIPMSWVDEAVLRILELKQTIGLFDNPFKGANEAREQELVYSVEHYEATRKVASESIVLLENDGILPLRKDMKIAIIGPYSESRATVGPWSWHGRRDFHENLAEVFEEQVHFVSSKESAADYTKEERTKLTEVDVILIAIGEGERLSGEAHSRSNIQIPGLQSSLVTLAIECKKPSVVLLHNGRPLILDDISSANAIVECFFLGSSHALAIKDVLLGDVNPSGKLTMSFPRNVGQIPVYYNHFTTGRPYQGIQDRNEYVSKYLDVENTPKYPFGYGLSYTTFQYDQLALSSNTMTPHEKITVSVQVTNQSSVPGLEVVQLYIRDFHAVVVRPIKELKGFQKLFFAGNESKTVSFDIGIEHLSYLLSDGSTTYDFGEFQVEVGSSSQKTLQARFTLI